MLTLGFTMIFFLIVVIAAVVGTVVAIVKSQQKDPAVPHDAIFEQYVQTSPMKLENFYDRPVDNPSWDYVESHIRKMLDLRDEHVLLSREIPTNGVSYVQSAQIPDGYTLQVGIEESGNIRLVEKNVTPDEIREIFKKFYYFGVVDGLENYKPVQRM